MSLADAGAEGPLAVWLGSLAALAALHAASWLWLALTLTPRSPYVEAQLLLSGVYVAVCGFRSLFPRVDLERLCVWDTWLSAVLLGRAAATVAELCFALQCTLFVQRLAEQTGAPMLATAAHLFVPVVIVAELLCWYAVMSLNHVGHALEEALWAAAMLLLAIASGIAASAADGALRMALMTGCLVYTVGAVLTLVVDVRMYVRRWRAAAAAPRLSLASGWRDTRVRRHPTRAWTVWREEAPWMTVYFSVGVWTSLAMVVL